MACPSLTPIKRGTERRLLSGSLPSELADEDWHRLRSCRCHLESGLLPPASVGDARVPLLPFSQFFLVSRTFYFFSRRRFAHSANLGDRKFSNKKEPYDLVTLYTGSEPSSSTRPSRVTCSENSSFIVSTISIPQDFPNSNSIFTKNNEDVGRASIASAKLDSFITRAIETWPDKRASPTRSSLDLHPNPKRQTESLRR